MFLCDVLLLMQADGDNQRVQCEDGQVEDDAHAVIAPVFLLLIVPPRLTASKVIGAILLTVGMMVAFRYESTS